MTWSDLSDLEVTSPNAGTDVAAHRNNSFPVASYIHMSLGEEVAFRKGKIEVMTAPAL